MREEQQASIVPEAGAVRPQRRRAARGPSFFGHGPLPWAATIIVLCGCQGAERAPRRLPVLAPPPVPGLVFGFSPAHGASAAAAWGRRLGDYLTSRLGKRIRPFVASSYRSLVDGLNAGRVDLGWLPPLVYAFASLQHRIHPVAKFVRQGKGSYYSALITHRLSGIKALRGMRDKRIAWTDPRSSGGYLFARAHLAEMGIDARTFFSSQLYLGSHRRVVEAVLKRRVDVGATFSAEKGTLGSAWEQFFPGSGREIRVLARAGPIPSDVIATNDSFDPRLAKKLLETLAAMHQDAEGRQLIEHFFNAQRALRARPEEYRRVAKMARSLRWR